MNISIESNARQLQKKLSLFQKKHLGKATNDAINKTLNGLKKEMIKQTDKKLDRPTPSTKKAFRVFESKINKLSGRLFILDYAVDYLKYQIDGGVRSGTPDVAVPFTKNVRLNKFGNVPARKSGLIKKNTQFVANIKGVEGIYQRMAKGKLKLLHGFEKTVMYTPRFPFFKIGKGYIKSKFNKNLDEKIKKEIARAK